MKAYHIALLCFTLIFPNALSAQTKPSTILVQYETFHNGESEKNNNPTLLLASKDNFVRYNKQDLILSETQYPFEQIYADLTTGQYTSFAQLTPTQRISTNIENPYKNYTLTNQTKEILGYICNQATISINSNTYTIWYTNELKNYGGPNLIGANMGLVLELDRNGTTKIIAQSINKEPTIDLENILQKKKTKAIDKSTYEISLFESRFNKISIFEDELINFNAEHATTQNTLRTAHGTLIYKKINLPTIQEGEQVFLSLTQQSNGDAYDRTGSVFLIPTDKKISLLDAFNQGINTLPLYTNNTDKQYQGIIATDNYTPAIELMRFFTPFGIGHFNNTNFIGKEWQDKTHYRQEISEYNSLLSNKEWYIGIYIGNYDKGGHRVTAELTIHPSSTNTPSYSHIVPVFNTTNILEMAGQQYPTLFSSKEGLVVKFTLDKPVKNAKLRYTTTGHGGWANGDEFNPKLNTLYLNKKELISYYPWREDCGSYRDYNPVSGNFSNGLSSSDLSRSNWCPATITYPIWIPIGDLNAGEHEIRLTIDQGLPQENSFSYWNTSAVIFGN